MDVYSNAPVYYSENPYANVRKEKMCEDASLDSLFNFLK